MISRSRLNVYWSVCWFFRPGWIFRPQEGSAPEYVRKVAAVDGVQSPYPPCGFGDIVAEKDAVTVQVKVVPGDEVVQRFAIGSIKIGAARPEAFNAHRSVIPPETGAQDGIRVAGQLVGQADARRPVLEVEKVAGTLAVAEDIESIAEALGCGRLLQHLPLAEFGGHIVVAQAEVEGQPFADGPLIVEKEAEGVGRAERAMGFFIAPVDIHDQTGVAVSVIVLDFLYVVGPGVNVGGIVKS